MIGRQLCLAMTLVLFTAGAAAQGRGGGREGGGREGGGARSPFGMPRSSGPGMLESPSRIPRNTNSRTPSAGRWWNDADFARSVGIDAGQQHRMDRIFNDNKTTLVGLYNNLQSQQQQLDTLRARNAGESLLFPQIDRVTQARGDLQKAYAHLQLQIRKELTPDQTTRLEAATTPHESN